MHLLVVGKLSSKEIQKLEDDYLKRLKKPGLKIHELKAHAENLAKESTEIINKIKTLFKTGSPHIILMTEGGKIMDSPDFSKYISTKRELHGDKVVFIIGGAAGFGAEIIKMASAKLSLSPLTFPHKLARLLLIEQLYRAETISSGHPYHK